MPTGAALQLVAVGQQDLALTGSPQITYFKAGYKSHTPFAEESIEQTFQGPADFGKRVICTIARNADLIRQIYLDVVLPAIDLSGTNGSTTSRFRWLNYPGLRLIKKVELEIGGQVIDRQYGETMYIWHQLTCPPGSRRNYEKMVGHTADLVLMKTKDGVTLDGSCSSSEVTNTCLPRSGTPQKVLTIPLQFWFCTNPGLALPLIALQYHEVKVNIELETFNNCCFYDGYSGDSGSTAWAPPAATQSLVAASLFVDYVYLDTAERRATAQKTHEYLIEQWQYTGAETLTASTYKSRLNFNHPVKQLYWVVQRDSYTNCQVPCPEYIREVGGQQPFNFTDGWTTEGLIMDVLGSGDMADAGNGTIPSTTMGASTVGAGVNITATDNSWGAVGGQTSAASLLYPKVSFGSTTGGNGGVAVGTTIDKEGIQSQNFILSTTNFLLAKLVLESGVKCEGKNPVAVAKLTLNGHERFSERTGDYFDTLQVWQKHTAAGATGINVYSFAMNPEQWGPSGTCNFSRIDVAQLHLTLTVETVRNQRTAQLRVYARNYNFLRVVSGMAGTTYAS